MSCTRKREIIFSLLLSGTHFTSTHEFNIILEFKMRVIDFQLIFSVSFWQDCKRLKTLSEWEVTQILVILYQHKTERTSHTSVCHYHWETDEQISWLLQNDPSWSQALGHNQHPGNRYEGMMHRFEVTRIHVPFFRYFIILQVHNTIYSIKHFEIL